MNRRSSFEKEADCPMVQKEYASSQDDATGERVRTITAHKKIRGEKSTVGANTFWNAKEQQITLLASIQINEKAYTFQKYVYFKDKNVGKAYEIYNTAKGDSPQNIRLNLQETQEPGLKELIENAI